MVVEVPLRNRAREIVAVALIDEQDAHLVDGKRWCLSHGYAVSWIDGGVRGLHRIVLGLSPGDKKIVDHKNRNKLDCRRENLRIVTSSANGQNCPSMPGSTSSYRGVSWDSGTQRWRATIMVDGKFIHVGRFDSEDEAAEAARLARAEHMAGALD